MSTQDERCGCSAWQARCGLFMLMLVYSWMLFFLSAAAASALFKGLWCEFSRNVIVQWSGVSLNSQGVLASLRKQKLLPALTENTHWGLLEDSSREWKWRKMCARHNGLWWDIPSPLPSSKSIHLILLFHCSALQLGFGCSHCQCDGNQTPGCW